MNPQHTACTEHTGCQQTVPPCIGCNWLRRPANTLTHIAMSKQDSVLTREAYQPPSMSAARPGADDFLNCPSRGVRC